MRLRIAELSAGAAGIALVVGLHINDSGGITPVTLADSAVQEIARAPGPVDGMAPTRHPPVPLKPESALKVEAALPVVNLEQSGEPVLDFFEAEQSWQQTRAEREMAESELFLMDQNLDRLADTFAAREEAGENPDALEIERSAQLDEFVVRYREVQQRLNALQEAEYRAAERMAAAQTTQSG